jgi:FkbM family methyltransferase
MILFLSGKIKFVLKSLGYYLPVLKHPIQKMLNYYLIQEQKLIFKYSDKIYYALHPKIKIKLNKNSLLSRLVLNDFEYEELTFLRKAVAEGDIVLDIGANIGIYTLLSSVYAGNTGMVHAFEPSLKPFKELNQNIEYNALKNVRTYNCAVSDKSDEMLELYEDMQGIDVLNNLIKPVTSASVCTKVTTISLDDFVLRNNVDVSRIKLVKIDVEGWELHVLHGAKLLLGNESPMAFLIEFTGENAIEPDKPNSIYDLMNEYGYKWYTYDVPSGRLLPFRTYTAIVTCNLIAVTPQFESSFPAFFKDTAW